MNWKIHSLNGFKKGFKVILELLVIILPIHLIIALLRELGFIVVISRICQPLMIPFGLPGEASIAMFLGYLVNLYAAVGAASALTLDWKQLSLIGLMLGIAHSLPLEAMIVRKVGGSALKSLLMRFIVSLIMGLILRIVFLWIG